MIRKVFSQMLVAQILSAMTVMICMLVDSIMIGRFLGVDSMTAYGLASPVLLVFAAFGSMLSAGVQVLCGKTVGSGDREGTDVCYSASVILAVMISVTGMLLILLFAGPVSTMLGAGLRSPENRAKQGENGRTQEERRRRRRESPSSAIHRYGVSGCG